MLNFAYNRIYSFTRCRGGPRVLPQIQNIESTTTGGYKIRPYNLEVFAYSSEFEFHCVGRTTVLHLYSFFISICDLNTVMLVFSFMPSM
ncbi:hypothetical protein SDC9_56599 [bioreactor metagenome]|uniref:Uncharacterized protein n=1 Tax=bioreactor metagenome TaxID=1076179 RepID=A0A644X303_9ZZZZ